MVQVPSSDHFTAQLFLVSSMYSFFFLSKNRGAKPPPPGNENDITTNK
jgi:hypothetical protein